MFYEEVIRRVELDGYGLRLLDYAKDIAAEAVQRIPTY